MTTPENKAIELALEGFNLIGLYKLQPDSVQSFVNHYTWHIKETLKKIKHEKRKLPQREWVELTDDEERACWILAHDEDDWLDVEKMIRLREAKLKEKNT